MSMFKSLIGDLFASRAQALVNTVNCVGVMGKGVALEFKKRFPEMFKDYDLYLNYMRGGPGFGDPIDRDPKAIETDLNQKFLLPEYAQKVYGAVFTQDAKGAYTVDAAKTRARRAEMRKERLARALPTREWMKEERERILNKDASTQVQHMFASSFGLSEKFTKQFKDFWSLPDDWVLREEDLGVPTYGSKYRMDLSLLPDVTTVVQVEE